MNRLIGAIVVAAAALSPLAAGAGECGALACRANGAPYVTDKNTIVIYPGESFAVDIDMASGKIGGPKPPVEDGAAANLIQMSFKPLDNGMLLVVTSHLAGTTKYDAAMKGPDGRVVYTSSCPIKSGLSNYENWPHPIQYLQLFNFRTLAPDADLRCE